MTLKGILDRKLFRLVVGPLLRRGGTVLATYLLSRGLPADHVEQFITALVAILGVIADMVLAKVSNDKAETKGASKMIHLLRTEKADDEFRPYFDPERLTGLINEAGLSPIDMLRGISPRADQRWAAAEAKFLRDRAKS